MITNNMINGVCHKYTHTFKWCNILLDCLWRVLERCQLSLQCCLGLASSRILTPCSLSIEDRHPKFAIHFPSRCFSLGKSSSLGPGSLTWSRNTISRGDRSLGSSLWHCDQCLQKPQSSPLKFNISRLCFENRFLKVTAEPVYCFLCVVHCSK